ncbi:MAG: class I SAM-dependent methyltransferase [Anaerolineales bacterium]
MSHKPSPPPRRTGPAKWIWRFVGWFLERLYQEWAWGYDAVANFTSMGQWWRWQTAVQDELPDGRWLELGFGTGRLLQRMLAANKDVIGLDPSAQMVARTAKLLRDKGFQPPLVRGEAQHLPFSTESFQAVYATFPSDYFFEEQSVEEMWRALEFGGKVVVVPYALITGRGIQDRLAAALYRLTGQSPSSLETDWLDELVIPGFELSYSIDHQQRADVLRVVLRKKAKIWRKPN